MPRFNSRVLTQKSSHLEAPSSAFYQKIGPPSKPTSHDSHPSPCRRESVPGRVVPSLLPRFLPSRVRDRTRPETVPQYDPVAPPPRAKRSRARPSLRRPRARRRRHSVTARSLAFASARVERAHGASSRSFIDSRASTRRRDVARASRTRARRVATGSRGRRVG